MVKITCDSTCDLTREMYKANDVTVLPLGVTLGDEFRRDGVDLTAQDIYDYVARKGILPKTSAISVGTYQEQFAKFVGQGDEVVHINLSSELSSCYQNACIAAQAVGNVYAVDSKSLSSGSGHLVLLAKKLAEQGQTAQQIAQVLEQTKQKLDISFVLQTLEYLHKGGRCSGVAAFGANIMKLRPEIVVTDGKMHVGKKYRGTMEKTILAYVRGRLEGRDDIDTERIIITHSGVPAEIVEQVKKLILQLQPFREILETTAGCTITSHCGPNCLGVLFLRK